MIYPVWEYCRRIFVNIKEALNASLLWKRKPLADGFMLFDNNISFRS